MRPRVLYVPIFGGFEAVPFARLTAGWADVESFDTPGAGVRRDQPPGTIEAAAAAGSERLDELGWDRAVLVCDSHGQATGVELALNDPRVAGLCISHAAPRYTTEGDRAPLNEAVYAAAVQLLGTDLRSFGHALTQLTQGNVDDEWVDAFLADVPRATARARTEHLYGCELVSRLSGTEVALLLARHVGCMLWTAEGYDDALAAVPHARTVECETVPLGSEPFADAVRSLCAEVFG